MPKRKPTVDITHGEAHCVLVLRCPDVRSDEKGGIRVALPPLKVFVNISTAIAKASSCIAGPPRATDGSYACDLYRRHPGQLDLGICGSPEKEFSEDMNRKSEALADNASLAAPLSAEQLGIDAPFLWALHSLAGVDSPDVAVCLLTSSGETLTLPKVRREHLAALPAKPKATKRPVHGTVNGWGRAEGNTPTIAINSPILRKAPSLTHEDAKALFDAGAEVTGTLVFDGKDWSTIEDLVAVGQLDLGVQRR